MKSNVIVVFNKEKNHVLMCLRTRDPYKGLYNFVGGKVEQGESSLGSAYRELYEETGIHSDDIELKHFMDFYYHINDFKLEVFVGSLEKQTSLKEEVHPLSWIPLESNFFDPSVFAGDGNIGHILSQIEKSKILK